MYFRVFLVPILLKLIYVTQVQNLTALKNQTQQLLLVMVVR